MINGKKTIALCTSRIYDPQTHAFIETLNEDLRAANINLLVFTISSDLYWEERTHLIETAVFDVIPYKYIDAVIIMNEKIKSHTVAEDIIAKAKKHHIPAIVVDGDYPGVPKICFDFAKGFESVVRHLVEHHGFKTFHMIAGFKNNAFSNERIRVFKKVLREHKIPCDDSMISFGDFWADPARKATKELIKSGTLPEAIVCANDIMAINVSDVLQQAGISIPDEVVVSGFDGIDEAFLTSPRILTADCNIYALAKGLFQSIEKALDGRPVEDVYVTPKLIPNESCGCARHASQSPTVLHLFNSNFYRYQDGMRELYNLTIHMQMSDSSKYLSTILKSQQDLFCVIDKDCLDYSKDFFAESDHSLTSGRMRLLYDASVPDAPGRDFELNPKELGRYLASGYPLIITSLDYMNVPLGYVGFFYKSYDLISYSKTASITDSISMGLGGFITHKYQKTLADQIARLYKNDFLTGLYNRVGFNAAFRDMMDDPIYNGKPVSIIMSDLDGLKTINDTYGHSEGDNAIKTVAQALKQACPRHALCVRFGGDEVCAIIFGDVDTREVIASIHRYLGDYNSRSGLPYQVSASCGSYTGLVKPHLDLKDLLKGADKQMYLSKQKKRSS